MRSKSWVLIWPLFSSSFVNISKYFLNKEFVASVPADDWNPSARLRHAFHHVGPLYPAGDPYGPVHDDASRVDQFGQDLRLLHTRLNSSLRLWSTTPSITWLDRRWNNFFPHLFFFFEYCDVTDIERATETAVATSIAASRRVRVGPGPLRAHLQVNFPESNSFRVLFFSIDILCLFFFFSKLSLSISLAFSSFEKDWDGCQKWRSFSYININIANVSQ